MTKNLFYFSLITFPIMLMSMHLEIFSINISDLTIMIYFFIVSFFILKEKRILVLRGYNNPFFYLFIIWLIIVTIRGILQNFNTDEGNIGNYLVKTFVGYIDDRSDFLNFFRLGNFETHLLTYLRFIFAFIVYYLGIYISYRFKFSIKYIKNGLIISIIINILLSLEQIMLGNRASGILGHAQDLSSLALMYVSLELVNGNRKNKFAIMLALVAIWMSETRSAYFALIILLISLFLKKFNIAKITILGTLVSTLLVSYYQVIGNIILNIMKLYTDPWDLMIRFQLWSKVFKDVSFNNFYFGANLFPSFTDNIIWYIVMSTGYIGLILFILLFIRESKIAQKNSNQLKLNFIIIFFGQGLLFNGFLGEFTIFMWFFIYGLIYKNLELNTSKRVDE